MILYTWVGWVCVFDVYKFMYNYVNMSVCMFKNASLQNILKVPTYYYR